MHANAHVNHESSAKSSSSLRKKLCLGVKITALIVVAFLFQFKIVVAAVHGSYSTATQSPIVLRASRSFVTSGGLNGKWIWTNKNGGGLVVVRRGKVIEPDPYLTDLQRRQAGTPITERYRILKSQNVIACKDIRAELVTYKQWPFAHTPQSISMFVVISGKQYVVTYTNLRGPGNLPRKIANYFRNFCGIENPPGGS